MVGLPGPTLDLSARAFLLEVQPMAVILFSRNCESATQLRALTDSLRALLGADLLIAIDEEGGRVSRLAAFCTATPAAAALSASGDLLHPVRAATITARRLRLLGIDFNLAPVLDLAAAGDTANALSGRCWGANNQQILATAGPWLEIFRKEKVLSCAKHFPGAGRAQSDPHHDLPQVRASEAELEIDLAPFLALLDRCDAVMASHLHYHAYSGAEPRPATLEPAILTRLLRDRLDFRGALLSDDLEMNAVMSRHSIAEACLLSLEAGADLPLVCHQPERIAAAASALRHQADPPRLHDATIRIEKLQSRPRAIDGFDRSRWQTLEDQARALLEETSGPEGDSEPRHPSPVQDY